MGRKVALLGMGALGQFLAQELSYHPDFELSFLWNRSKIDVDQNACPFYHGSQDMNRLLERHDADLVIECAHPQVVLDYGVLILDHADFMPTSLTAFAIQQTLMEELIMSSNKMGRSIFIPSGASWGIPDIAAMALTDRLEHIEVNMTFASNALKLTKEIFLDPEEKTLVKRGSILDLAKLAPNNVNTMVSLALVIGTFDESKISGALYANPTDHTHRVEINVKGRDGFEVNSLRVNPAKSGAVTGSQTFYSFLASVLKTKNLKKGLRFV